MTLPRCITVREALACLGKAPKTWQRRVGNVPRWMARMPALAACAIPDPASPGRYLIRADLLRRVLDGEQLGGGR